MTKLIGDKIRKFRRDLNLNVPYVANYLNVSIEQMLQIEDNELGIYGREVTELSKLFGVSEMDLLFDKDNFEFTMFYNKIDKRDRAEITALITFKEKIRKIKK